MCSFSAFLVFFSWIPSRVGGSGHVGGMNNRKGTLFKCLVVLALAGALLGYTVN